MMSLKTTINIDAIDYITLFPEKKSYIEWDTWYKSKFNWRKLKFEKVVWQKGYNNMRGGNLKTEEELFDYESNIKIVEDKVYRKSCVQIAMRNKDSLSKYFNTNEEAENYYNSLNRKLTNKTEL